MADNKDLIAALSEQPTTADVLARMPPQFGPWGGTTPQGFFRGVGNAANAFIDPARNILSQGPRMLSSGGYDPGPDALALALMQTTASMPLAQTGAVGSGGGRLPNPIRAYHGSPHDFDVFDAAHIGKGEGAQAYGHGIYFAEKEGVAKSYKESLAQLRMDGKPFDEMNPSHIAAEYVQSVGSPEQAIKALNAQIEGVNANYEGAHRARLLRARGMLERGEPLPQVENSGKMYEVALHAEPSQFLDWDKPLSGQSEGVRAAVEANRKALDAFHQQDVANAKGFGQSIPGYENAKGEWLYRNLPGAEATLREAGIPGIRYKDQGSRQAQPWIARHPQGGVNDFPDEQAARAFVARNPEYKLMSPQEQATHNYVVFPGPDGKGTSIPIAILRKYGMLAPVAAPTLANALSGTGSEGQQ